MVKIMKIILIIIILMMVVKIILKIIIIIIIIIIRIIIIKVKKKILITLFKTFSNRIKENSLQYILNYKCMKYNNEDCIKRA